MQINGASTSECPVSLTDGWIFEMLILFSEATRFEGSALYGNDLSEWPADVYDAFAIFHYEENRIQISKMEADKPPTIVLSR